MDTDHTRALRFDPELLARNSFPEADLQVPEFAEVDSSWLYWAWHEDPQARELRARYRSPAGMLAKFTKIRNQVDILKFTVTYGALGICDHDLPAMHNAPAVPGALKRLGCRPVLASSPDDPWASIRGRFQEPLHMWITYVRAAQGILSLATSAYRGRPLDAEAVAAVGLRPPGQEAAPDVLQAYRNNPYQTIAAAVNWWLWIGNASVTLDWQPGRAPAVKLSGARFPYTPATFGVLAGQLMLAVARAHALLLCSACGLAYTREERYQPRKFKGINYCPACKEDGVPNKIHQRTAREKARAKARARA